MEAARTTHDGVTADGRAACRLDQTAWVGRDGS